MSGPVLLAGDTHGNLQHFAYLLSTAEATGCERLIQLGDFGYWPHISDFHEQVNVLARRAGVEVFWIDGNHENFDRLEEAVGFDADEPQEMGTHLTYLPRGCVWTWDDCRFMALGGAYSIDKAHRREGYSWWPQELLTSDQVIRAMSRGPVDVLLSHDAPDGVCPIISTEYKGDEISRGNRLAVSAVVDAVQPSLVFHGHYHHRYMAEHGPAIVTGLDCDGSLTDSWCVIDPAAIAQANRPLVTGWTEANT